MDLDNINDIEVLRSALKNFCVKMKQDAKSINCGYTFKKGFWYFVEQDEYGVSVYSDDYEYSAYFYYKEASKYLEEC